MTLSTAQELKNYDKIILSDDNTDTKTISNLAKESKQKILILFVSKDFPKDINLLNESKTNLSYKLFSWSLFSSTYLERWHSHNLSIKNSKIVYKKLLKKNKFLIFFFSKIYSSNDINLSFEKAVATHLKDYYEIIKIYDLIKKYNNNITPLLEKNKYHAVKKIIKENSLEKTDSDFHQRAILYNKNNFRKKLYFNILTFVLYPFFALLSIRKFKIKKISKIIGLRMYKQGLGFDRDKHHSDWIVDDNYFNNKNSIFVFEDRPNKKHINDIKKKNYDFFYCTNRIPLKICSLTFFLKIIFFYTPAALVMSPVIFLSNSLLREEAIIAWLKFFAWKNFISVFNLKFYLSYHNYTSDHIYRNILLKKISCSSIMYKHTHCENVFDYKNRDRYAHVDQMHLYYDIEYHWSKCSIEMTKSNKSKSKEFLVSGPIWSSKAITTKKHVTNNKPDEISIALFSTAFSGFTAVNSIESHEKFLVLASEIIKKYPNINILFKPKSDIKIYEENKNTKILIKSLLSLNNFKPIDNSTFSNKIIRAVDVVISMPFASSGIEAMCLGIKSFYVDSLNVYKNSYFDNFKNLVSHSNESALENLKYWMKTDREKVPLMYEEIFQDMGLKETDKAIEIIRNKIINEVVV